jgi:membrane-associated phospholipid phosphatase
MAEERAWLRRIRRPGPLVAMSIAYLALVSGVMMWRGISVSPDYLLLCMVPLALLTGRFVSFLRDYVPFVALFLGYEALAGVASKLGIKPKVWAMVDVERALFLGHSPNEVLQKHFGGLHWLVVACTVVYFCHFLYPLLVGLVLWLINRAFFLRYVVALLGMSFAAFVVFLLVPTAPPWLANHWGALPGVRDLVYQTLPSRLSPYFQRLDADPIAAFPSLHAAYPTLGALALWQVNKRTAYFTVPWCFIVFFSVVFLGQHYAIDVLGGIAVAAVTWLVINRLVVPHVPALSATRGLEERMVAADEAGSGPEPSGYRAGPEAELQVPEQTGGDTAGAEPEPVSPPGGARKR